MSLEVWFWDLMGVCWSGLPRLFGKTNGLVASGMHVWANGFNGGV